GLRIDGDSLSYLARFQADVDGPSPRRENNYSFVDVFLEAGQLRFYGVGSRRNSREFIETLFITHSAAAQAGLLSGDGYFSADDPASGRVLNEAPNAPVLLLCQQGKRRGEHHDCQTENAQTGEPPHAV